MLKPLVILGAGGFARETLDLVEVINSQTPQFDVLGFIVDEQYALGGEVVNDRPVLGGFSWLEQHAAVLAVCGVGAPEVRRRMVLLAAQLGIGFATLVSPDARLTRWVDIGPGSIITAGCILTNRISVGAHVQINLDCTIGHDAALGDFATLAPGVHVSGRVVLEEGCYIGTGVNIIERKTIGAWSIVGAGSTITQDVPPNTTVVGVPGRVVKTREPGWHLQ